MKIALAQINPVVGDTDGNKARILERIEEAKRAGAALVVFPEMCINGYPPRDLLAHAGFVERGIAARDAIAAATHGIHALVGYVDVHTGNNGRPFRNAAALLGEGRVLSVHHKMLLPTYDIFDEDRYFEPGDDVSLIDVAGRKIGVTICEDIWNEPRPGGRRRYERDPVEELAAAGAQIVVNLSSSPFEAGKTEEKYRMIRRRAKAFSVPFVYVNQVGGNDELVFDGASVAFNAAGQLIARAECFEEALLVVDTSSGGADNWDRPEEIATIRRALVLGLRDYARKCGFCRVVLGLSGGIDSAVTAAIAVEALGSENVTGIAMPSRYSSEGSRTDAEALARNLGIRCDTIPIETMHTAFEATMEPAFAGGEPGVAEENMQARIRGNILMAWSNRFGALLLTTGNKSEIAVGYCTLYGDMSGGLAVLSDVPKTMVYEIANEINRDGERIPQSSIDKVPSAELRPDQTDQDSLPPYETLDGILEMYVERARSVPQIAAAGYDEATVRRVARMVDRNEYKRRQAPPGIKVTSKAFGSGRRIPIARHLPH